MRKTNTRLKEVMLIQSVFERVVCIVVPCVGAVVLLSRGSKCED